MRKKTLAHPTASALSTESARPTLICSLIFTTLLGLGWSGGAEAEGDTGCPSHAFMSAGFGQWKTRRQKPEHPFFSSLPYHPPFPTISWALVPTIQVLNSVRFHQGCQPLLLLVPSVWGCLPALPNLGVASFSLCLSHL